MKVRRLFVLILLAISGVVCSQVAKENVVIEKFTGIYCGACPGAVHNIHDLIENENANVIVLSHHAAYSYSDPLFENPDSDGRLSYYSSSISGFPTTIFDGTTVAPFADGYQGFLGSYNSRKDLLSPVSIGLDYTWNGDDSYTAHVTVTKESDITATDLRLQVAITETNIDFAWMGEEKLYDVGRKMIPNHNGTSLDLSTVTELSFDLDFTLDADWNPDYCKVLAFVQDHTSQEIFQGSEVSIANTTEANDASPYMILGVDEDYCGSNMSPQVWIANSSGSNLTSLDINYSINGGTVETFNWTGDLAPFEQELVSLSSISFVSQTTDNELTINTSNPNGSTDEDNSNDEISKMFDASPVMGSTPSIEFRTDEWPFLNSWELLDSEGNVVEQSGSLSSYTVYTENFDLADGCYTFKIYDDTGNGFVNWAGEDGYFIFYDDQGNEMENVINFGYELTVLFEVSSSVNLAEKTSQNKLNVYPNPSKDFITISNNSIMDELKIINSLGQAVLLESNIETKRKVLDVSDLTSGIYIVHVKNMDGILTMKIRVK